MSGIQNSDVARTPSGEDPATKPLPQLLDTRKFGDGVFQGIVLPYYKRDSDSSVQQQVKKIKEFKFKDGDMLLCAYPKSGKSSRLDGRVRGTGVGNCILDFNVLSAAQVISGRSHCHANAPTYLLTYFLLNTKLPVNSSNGLRTHRHTRK